MSYHWAFLHFVASNTGLTSFPAHLYLTGPHTAPTPRKQRRFNVKSNNYLTRGMFAKVLALVRSRSSLCLSKMARGACAAIVVPLTTSPFDIATLYHT